MKIFKITIFLVFLLFLFPNLPVWANNLTIDNVTLEDRNLCSQAGSNDFLTKPINREKMYQITKKYLEKTKN